MAPDAEKLRLRKQPTVSSSDGEEEESTEQRIVSLKNLKSNEVCIDGIVYDLNSFVHPGGDTIQIFGGNDVTVQYRMIHPYHTSHHLEKMKATGKVMDFTSEYKFDTEFEREIKREVFKIVHRGREFATPGYFFRAVCYIALFFYLQYLWITTQGSSWHLAIVYGVSQALIGMNVQHDANHGAVSAKYTWMNDVLGLGADFIGGSKWLWLNQHWTHHAFTNHYHNDPDARSGEPVFIWNDYEPDHPRRRWYHKFQGVFFLFVLCFYWITAVFNPQVIDLRQRGAQDVGINMDNEFLKRRRPVAVLLRLMYIGIHVVLPFWKNGFTFGTLADILILGFSESLTLALLFALSHNFEDADRNPTEETKLDDAGKVCWYKSQVETSCTYGGALAGYLTGGLNFQVEHHLFPRMSSAWYPYIAPKVREICAKHGVKYAYYPWVWQNLKSTIVYMHRAGMGSNWQDGNPYTGKL